jgi:signal transduction histidine kinase/putative methionine-R-sulfoxide reductase with GAF domain
MDQDFFSINDDEEIWVVEEDEADLETELSKRLNLYNEIGRVMLSSLDEKDIYKVAVEALHFSMGLRHVALFQIDYQFNDLVLKAQTGDYVGIIPANSRISLNKGLLGKTARDVQSQVLTVSKKRINEALVPKAGKEIYVPVKIEGQCFAVLYLACNALSYNRPFDLLIFENIASQVGVAIQNARLFTEVNQTRKELGILLTASRDLSTSLDLHTIVDHLANRLIETIADSRLALIQFKNENTASLRRYYRVATPENRNEQALEVRISDYPELSPALNSRQATVTYHTDSTILPRRIADQVKSTEPTPFLVIPLMVQDTAMGVIVVNKVGIRQSFSERELGICQTLANIASISLHNAGLFHQINVANEQLKKLSAMKSDLLHIISHDLKSPLTVISGYAELLLERPEAMAGRWEATLAEIISQTQMMARLIEDTLAVSRIESGVMELNLCDLNLLDILDNVVAIHQHECLFHKNLPDQLPRIRADKLRLHEILENLIGNAIKYSDPESREIIITVLPDLVHQNLIVRIKDKGFGIAEAEIPRLFSKFYRVKNDRTQRISGTGLGLYIVKQMVDAHHGEIWVESKPGQGSTFSFSLPLAL